MRHFFSLLLFTSFFLSCKKNDVQPGTSDEVLMPLKNGNQWTYRKQRFFEDGSAFYDGVVTFTANTASSLNYNGSTYIVLEPDLNTAGLREYYRNVDNNTVEVFTAGAPFLLFKRVTTNGTVLSSDSSAGGYTRVLTGYTELININGHNCIRNEMVYARNGVAITKTNTYLKPGLGVVRFETVSYRGVPANVFTAEKQDLLSYSFH